MVLTPPELKSAIVRHPLVIAPDQMVADAIAQMSDVRRACSSDLDANQTLTDLHLEARSSCILVIESGRLVGILTERDIVRLSANQCDLKNLSVAEAMTHPVISLRESDFTDIFSVVALLQQQRIRHVPLLDDRNQVVGLLTHESLRQLSCPADLLRLRLVSEVMTTDVVCASPQVSMLAIAQLMTNHRVGSIVLVNQQESPVQREDAADAVGDWANHQSQPLQIPIGIITERDIVQFQSLELDLATVQAEAVMSTPVFSIRPDESLWIVQQMMAQWLIRRLVVTGEQGELVGIVTQTSILRVLKPVELYTLTEVLEQRVSQLEAEKVKLLENYAAELEQQVEQRTAEIKAQAERERLVSSIALCIRQSLQVEEILETAVVEVRRFLNTDRVLVYQFSDQGGRVITESVLPGWTTLLGQQIHDVCLQQTLGDNYQTLKTWAIADVYEAELTPCHLQLLEQFEIRSSLIAPILVHDQPWGLLIAHQCSAPRQWQPIELELLDQLVAQIAIAIQQATANQQAQAELAERQRAEIALRESEQRFQSMAANVPGAIFRYLLRPDRSDAVLYMNPGCYDLWEVEASMVEASAAILWQMADPEELPALYESVMESGRTLQPWSYTWRITTPSGRQKWLEASGRPTRQANGDVIWDSLILDVSDRQLAQQALEYQVKFDRLVASISSRFIQFSSQEMTAGINLALQEIGEFTQVDSCYIFQYADHSPTHSMTHEWVAAGISPNLEHTQNLPLDLFPWATAKLQNGEIVYISSLDMLPPEAAIDHHSFQRFGIQSSLTIPLCVHNQVIGLVGFASFHHTYLWSDDNIRLLRIFADILANALQRQQAEMKLQVSSQRYASLAKAAPVGIFLTDTVGNCLYVNDRWSQIAGLSLTDALGMGWVNGLHPDDRDQIAQEWYQATQENRPFRLEYRFQRPDGSVSWVFGQAIAEYDATGQVDGYIGTITDISDRKATESALQDSEERLRLTLTAANQGLYDLNLQTGEAIVSPEYAIMLGYDPATFKETNAKWIERLHPDDHESVTNVYQAYVEGKISDYAVEFRQRTLDGKWKWVLSLGKIVAWDESGQPLRMLGTHTDITERKKAEANRLQAEKLWLELDLLENILDVVLAGYWDWDIPNNREYLSPGFKRMFGYDDDELSNTPETWQRLIFPDDLPRALDCFDRHVQSHGAVPFYNEVRYRHKNGSTIWVICSGRVIEWGEAGQPIRMIGCHIDITLQKQIEEELRQAKEEFERFFNVALDLLCIADTDGHFRRLNRAWETTLGYPLDELEGQLFLEFVHPDDLASTLEAISNLSNQESIRAFVNRYRCHNGTYRYIEWYSRPYGNMIYAAARDITQRMQVEEQLRRSSAHLQTAQRISQLGSWEFDVYTGQVIWSDEVFRIFGREPGMEPPTFEELQQLIHPDDRDRHQQLVHNAIATIQPYEIECQFYRSDGTLGHFQARGEPIVDPTGQLVQLVGTVLDITDRKQAEQELIRSRDLREAIFNESTDALFLVDPHTLLILDCNRRAAELFKVADKAELIGISGNTLQRHPFSDQELTEISLEMQTQGFWSREIEYITRQGDFFWGSIAAKPIVIAGRIKNLVRVTDISDRKQAEAALQESERRFATLSEAAPVALFRFDAAGSCIYLNDRWSEMTERSIEEGLGWGWTETIHPQDREWIFIEVPQWLQTCKAGDLYRNEARILRPDGSIIWYVCQILPETDSNGTIIGYVGTLTDISDRKQAEAQLQTLSDRLSLAITSAAMGIWDWDVTQNSLSWDARMYELYGLMPNQFLSVYEGWASRLHPDDRPLAEAAIQQALRDEKDYDPEFRVVLPDGTIRFIKAYALVQRDAQGEAQRMIGINFDITDRKEAELKLLQTTAQLEASNQELEAFAYSVSHDLRSPLRAIDGFSRALLEDYGNQFGEEGKDYFDRIRHNVNRMGTLIDDLLHLSRVSRSEMQYCRVNLTTLMQEQIDELQATEPARQVNWVVAQGAIVSADATLMRVVINNLVQNAWKFTSHHATARIEFGITQQAGQSVYFMRDDGAGFDMAYANMLFGVFQRLHNTHEFPGTGIGLATVQRAIHRHGGRVWAEGAIEQGATFYFTLPNTST